jgi:hypothetical protein
MAPYMSLFVHESYRKLKAIDPKLSSLLSRDAQSIVARSRHSLKLFEDNQRGVTGQLDYFRDDILPAHRKRFLGNTWFKPAQILEVDLGLYSYDNHLIGSTHGLNFHVGVEPAELLEEGGGSQLRAMYEEYGAYFARLGARLDSAEPPTFVSHLNPQKFNQRSDDVRAERYYGRIFDGNRNPDLNALLAVFQSMLNFVDTVITADEGKLGIEYTVWKIRFLTLYQVLGSLRILRNERLRDLTPRSVSYIDQITTTSDAQLVMTATAKPFRNTLMHYNLDSRIDSTQVNPSEMLFGLVPLYFPSHTTASLAVAVDRCIAKSATLMDEWGEGKT